MASLVAAIRNAGDHHHRSSDKPGAVWDARHEFGSRAGAQGTGRDRPSLRHKDADDHEKSGLAAGKTFDGLPRGLDGDAKLPGGHDGPLPIRTAQQRSFGKHLGTVGRRKRGDGRRWSCRDGFDYWNFDVWRFEICQRPSDGSRRSERRRAVTASAMIRVVNLRKEFSTRQGMQAAVRGVDFEVNEGEIFMLLGPSGCGKTTTLRCIAGLETPDEGEIRLSEQVVFGSGGEITVPVYQ